MAKFNSILYNIDELIEMLKISRATAYRLVGKNKISFIKVGKGIRFREKDIQDYLEKNEVESLSKK